MLANDHDANVTLSSLVYDPDESNLLVAAFTVTVSVELLAAIKAQLEKHGDNARRVIDLAAERCAEGWQAVIGAGLREGKLVF